MIQKVKQQLEHIISLSDVNMGIPIQIAEVLYHSRVFGKVCPDETSTYASASLGWRNAAIIRLTGKVPKSLVTAQPISWDAPSMPPGMLARLDRDNKKTGGAVERYIYTHYSVRHEKLKSIIRLIESASPATFHLGDLLAILISHRSLSDDPNKAYNIILCTLLETIGPRLKATLKLTPTQKGSHLHEEFPELASVILGLGRNNHRSRNINYSKASTECMDTRVDFGRAVQVKYLTLDESPANRMVDQVESDSIVIVCRDADAEVIQTVIRQIGWGRRVRGVVKETHLIEWYERCLRGKFKDQLARPLLERLTSGFKEEFPQALALTGFLEERGYAAMTPPERWKTETERTLSDR